MRRRGAKMIGRRLIAAAILLSSCVVSLPVTPGQLENDDVEVMKCIVEALADVVSRPHPQPSPITQECMLTLKSDDRLVKILRHHKFLKELQEMALEGSQERALLQPAGAAPQRVTARPPATPPAGLEAADRSMLEALGGPGERSILSQQKRNEDGEDDSQPPPDGEQRRRRQGEVELEVEGAAKTGNPESPPHHGSRSAQEQRKRAELTLPGENTTAHGKGSAWDEKRESRSSTEKTEASEEEESKAKRLSEEEEEGVKSWTQRAEGRGRGKEARLHAASHHSREAKAPEEEAEVEERSPEERELQMLAGREPQQRALLEEEEGSAARRTEEPEIQSLAAIESELENVAQKLHDLRRG